MNPEDKPVILPSQNRRSTRVKNLTLQQQKEMEKRDSESRSETPKKILDIENILRSKLDKDNLNSSSEDYVTLKSYKELGITTSDKKIFNFIMPPKNVLESFEDFELSVKPMITPMASLRQVKENTNKRKVKLAKKSALDKIIEQRRKKLKLEEKVDMCETSMTNLANFQKTFDEMMQQQENIISDVESDIGSVILSYNSNGNDSYSYKNNRVQVNNGHLETFDSESVCINNGQRKSPEILDFSNIVKKCQNLENKTTQNGNNCINKNIFPPFLGFDIDDQDILNKISIMEIYIKNLNQSSALKKCSKTPKNILNSTNTNQQINNIKSVKPNAVKIDKDEVVGILTRGKFVSFDVESETSSSSDTETDEEIKNKCEIVSPYNIKSRNNNVLPFEEDVEIKSLHQSLARRKVVSNSICSVSTSNQDWDSDSSYEKQPKQCSSKKRGQHFISFDKQEYGSIQNIIYVDFNLIVVQEYGVSMWNQTALGNVLGVQNLWVSYGSIRRMILNKECVRKNSLEMTISLNSSVVYVEIWTKEHKSEVREVPVADIFSTVYFWTPKANKIDKKVLQLENINGFADDVQYVALKNTLNIVVSWNTVVDRNKQTLVRIYTLANDFQTISKVRAIAKVEHYVSSLHNIEDCDELLMGCGENKVTLWNIEYGYIVATIELQDIKLSLNTLWAKCDRGILFTIQQCVDRELRLIAINGRNHSWKKLKSYMPPEGYERIQNVYIENGMLMSFYDEGLLCWKAQSEKDILEEIDYETDVNHFPSGKYLIIVSDEKIFVKHALTHVLL